MSLDTTDHGEAVRKVLEYRAQPHLGEIGRWDFEVEQYLGDQEKRRCLSVSYAGSRRYVLKRFAQDTGIDSPREVTVGRATTIKMTH